LQQVLDRFVVPTLEGEQASIRLELMGEVPIDASVREAVQRRQLLLELLPGSAAAQAVVEIATRLKS
jgi:flagellar biosynthesis protein FlhG